MINGAASKEHFNLDWLIGSLPKSSFGMIILFLAMLPMVPVITLEIPDISGRDLPRGLAEDVNTYINRALSRRPDILATLAKLRTTEAEIDVARATYYPTLGLEGYVNQNVGSLSVNHGPNYRVDEPAAGILFKLSLPLYDGSIRENVLNIARSRNEAAKEELSKIQDEAVRQIARSYDAVKSALAEYNAARALVEASDTAYVAVLDSYRNGLGTLINAGTAGTETTHAQSIQSQAYALVPTAAAALAFSTGELTKADVLNHPP